MSNAHETPPAPLASRCQAETEKFLRRLPYDPHFCFRLFQRAFCEHDGSALADLQVIYRPLVYSWAKKHTLYPAVSAHLDLVLHYTFTRFWRATRTRFAFDSLPAIMGYISRCVGSAVIDVYREHCGNDAPLDEWSVIEESPPLAPAPFSDVWARVCVVLPEAEYQVLARRVLIEGYKPAEVAALHTTLWPTARAVSVALQTVLRRLRKDAWLRDLLDDETPPTLA